MFKHVNVLYIQTYATTTIPLSLLSNTRKEANTCTKGQLLAVSWPFHPAMLPHSWPTAWLIQLCWGWQVGLLSGWSNMGGFITPSSKCSSPDWGPSGKEEGCQRGLAPQPLTVCLYEIEWVSICLCHTGLCYHNLFRSLTCLGGVRTVHSRISFRNEDRAHAITLTTPMLPTFYVMVFDTRVSSEQTVKQQEHIMQGVAPDGHEYGNGVCSASS